MPKKTPIRANKRAYITTKIMIIEYIVMFLICAAICAAVTSFSEDDYAFTVFFLTCILFTVSFIYGYVFASENEFLDPANNTTLEQEYWLRKHETNRYDSFDTLWVIKEKYEKIKTQDTIKTQN